MPLTHHQGNDSTKETRGSRFVFIGGAPRSGTTLLQNMLDSHPDIFGGPEFLHLPALMQLRSRMRQDIQRQWISAYCSEASLDALLRELIEKLLLPLADDRGCPYLSEKSPENVLAFSDLAQLLPDAHFFHVVRDPRATVASLLEVGKRARKKRMRIAPHTANLHNAIAHVDRCLSAGFGACASFPKQTLTLKYEELVSNTEQVARQVCDFIEIAWSPQMLNPSSFHHLGQDAITKHSGELWYDAKSFNRDPNTESVEKWRTQLSPMAQVAVSDFFKCNRELIALGYDLASPETDRARHWAFKIGNATMGSFRRLSAKARHLAMRLP